MKILSLVYILFVFFSQPALALVNMKNASYSEKWVDIIVPGKGYDFRIERFYSSRSLFIGTFGFGWCSDLETKLAIRSDGRLVLTECGGGLEITYYPKQFDKRSVTRTIDQIIKSHRKKNRSISKQSIKQLRIQLITDTKQRFEMAKIYGLIDGPLLKTKKNIFVPTGNSAEQINFDGKNYTRRLTNGSIQKFNPKGKLVQALDIKGNWIKLTYAGDRLSFVGDNLGRNLIFSYKPNGKLEKIHNGQGVNARYEFKAENLSRATTAWNKSYKYQYDQGHNLTKVLFPDNSNITMSYEYRSDWIKSYRDRHGCTQSFKFILSRDDPKNHYTSTTNKTCSGKIVESWKIEFWYKKHKNSLAKYLHRILSILSGLHKDTYFHPIFGRPTSIAKNNSTERFSYYQNGLTHFKEQKMYNKKRDLLSWENSTFQYNNTHKKISEVNKIIFNKKGKRKKSVKTKFFYNKKGLLLSAKRPSTGEEVKVKYNSSSKISQLTNHKKVKFNFLYGFTHDKPETIEQVGLGKVTVDYSVSGEVTKVRSPKGRSIASSIIKTFLSFVDICGAAADELVM